MVPDVGTQGTPLRTVGKAWFMKSMHILSEVCYFIYNHNKRQQPIVSLGRGQGTVMGVAKQVYTLLIWTLLLVLSLSTLSRASKPRIASMNSILCTCMFINCCVYSRSTSMLVPVPYGPWEVHWYKCINYIYTYTLLKFRICMAQLIHFGRDSLHLTVCSRALTHFVFVL